MSFGNKRDKLRSELLKKREFKKKIITLFDQEVEIRQPSLGQVLTVREEKDRRKLTHRMYIDHCFVPGTDEKVFEEGDLEVLMALPFEDAWIQLSSAVAELTGVDLEDAEKNSESTPSDETS